MLHLSKLRSTTNLFRQQRSNFSKLGSTFNQGRAQPEADAKLKFTFNNLSKHIRIRTANDTDKKGGLFNNKHLSSPSGFGRLKQKAETRVNALIDEAMGTAGNKESRKLVQIFDDISNELCCVADAAEFVRTSHPDTAYRNQADEVYAQISQIVERLNTNHELYSRLKLSLTNDKRMDECDKRVCRLLLADFEQSGIHLDEQARNKFVHVNDELIAVLMQFQINSQQPALVNARDVDEKFKPMLVGVLFFVFLHNTTIN